MLTGKTIMIAMTDCTPVDQMPDIMCELRARGTVQADEFREPAFYDHHHRPVSACDLSLVVPAFASTIGKMAKGIADNFVTTIILSVETPVVFAAHMNPMMYKKARVRRNIRTLREDGAVFAENGAGKERPGSMPANERILGMVCTLLCGR